MANDTTPFEFYNKNGELVSEQLIKNGDLLEEVGSPYESGKVFKNWIVVSSNDNNVSVNTKVTLPCTISNVGNEDTEVVLKPEYGDLYYVTFHEYARNSTPDVIQTKKLVDLNGTVVIGDVIAPQPDETHIFYAWSDGTNTYPVYNDGVLDVNTSISNITTNKDLYPVFVEAYWLRFVSGEIGSQAEYVPARFVLANSSINKLPKPTRKGYEFAGWYEGSISDGKIIYNGQVSDENGNVINPSTGLTLTSETTLYAMWTPNTNAKYTVIFWRQKVSDNKGISEDDKTYDYVTSEVRNGQTDAEVSATSSDISKSGGDYTGFHYARTVQNSLTINADGSTVINVYYDRNLMAINFYYKNGDQPSGAQTAYTYVSTTSENGTQYGVLEDGTYVQLSKSTTTATEVYYTYDGFMDQVRYNDTFYVKKGSGWSTYYEPTQYNGNNLPPENDNTTYYTESYGIFGNLKLTRRIDTTNTTKWSYTLNGVTYPYTGTRYTRTTNNTYPYMVTWTGLYGQSFNKYGYVWPNSIRWNEATDGWGTNQTLLTAFVQNENPYNLYDQGSTGSYTIYHYKQGLDGKYSQTENVTRFTAKGSGGTFSFSNKFEGFKVDTYGEGNKGFSTNGGNKSALKNGKPKEDVDVDFPLHVYHTRNKWKITYKSEGEVVYTTNEIYYEAPIASYNYSLTDVNLNERDHYEFTGWYSDETCTVKFNFNDASGMPDANVVVYAGWKPIWYQVIVDPNGGVITPDIGSTYMWKQYGDTISRYEISRDYIEDKNGSYKYVYVDGREDPDGNVTVRTATYETAESGYTGTKYRKLTTADPKYVLVGWYVVDENDNMTDTPYDFAAPIEGPVTIRAKWRLEGSYKLQYNATNTVDGVEVSGVFTQSDPSAEYADGSMMVIQAPPTNVTQKYVFDGWYVADENGSVLDDNGGSYYAPGDELILNAGPWARNKIIYFRAHYTKVEESTDPISVTKLILDANGGAFADVPVSQNENDIPYITMPSNSNQKVSIEKLHINQAVELSAYSDKLSREGYELIGWSPNQNATEKQFGADATVAADNLPDTSNTLYAVWHEVPFYVFHSSDGKVDVYYKKDLDSNGKFDIKSKVKSGYLYGGYFKKYYNVTDAEAIAVAGKGTAATSDVYVGDALYKKVSGKIVRYWTANDAYTNTVEGSGGGIGTAMTVKPGTVYYLREVNKDFLGLRVQVIYDKKQNNNIDDLYLITTTDNNIYQNAGFKVKTDDQLATFYSAFSIQQRYSSTVTSIKAVDINGVGGYVDVWKGTSDLISNADNNTTFSVKPFWTTKDGVRVDDRREVRTFNIGDKTFGNEGSLYEVE